MRPNPMRLLSMIMVDYLIKAARWSLQGTSLEWMRVRLDRDKDAMMNANKFNCKLAASDDVI
jgi:hypothetical protein